MSNIKDSLTKKLGPLPAWAWMLIAGIGIYLYRRSRSGGGLFSSLLGAGSGTSGSGTAAPPPQPPTVLDPGQSIYDPGTGSLTTAPGGGNGGNSTDPSSWIGPLADAIGAAIAADIPAPPAPVTPTPAPTPTALQTLAANINNGTQNIRKIPIGTQLSLVAAGLITPDQLGPNAYKQWVQQRSQSQKTTKTTGGKHTVKQKQQNTKPPVKSTKTEKPSHKSRSRSSASVKTTTNHAVSRHVLPLGMRMSTNRAVTPTVSAGTRLRQTPKVPTVRQTAATQHPAATHPRQTAKPAPQPAPRPSSPPPRMQRTRTLARR